MQTLWSEGLPVKAGLLFLVVYSCSVLREHFAEEPRTVVAANPWCWCMLLYIDFQLRTSQPWCSLITTTLLDVEPSLVFEQHCFSFMQPHLRLPRKKCHGEWLDGEDNTVDEGHVVDLLIVSPLRRLTDLLTCPLTENFSTSVIAC